ncbi:proteasome subunit beta type 4 [Uncinocarpus reesii 1704]|uniref:Proteasome subunit beta type 4 n=1 Tax=Uncinocarpus reesii (strain UAMH 1704) TaxID=336963 RepID=C4K083_UNCRE|nr:proteasome subunit beta type 4 [Uncinocarpus reesii 1704]EEP82969.1 proteasome subunit beta type 4 [Uncinocarpus reesii 1704]
MGPFQPPEQFYSKEETASLPHKSSLPSSQRSLIRDMTLPPYPNLDIPPSPPGSPSPSSNQKFTHFLSLKKQGIHFNEKLASSSSLKNPSLFSSLRKHAGLEERSQYATSLDLGTWDVSGLPEWGYKEELQKVQQEIRSKIKDDQQSAPREGIDFVQASKQTNRSESPGSRTVNPHAVERGTPRDDVYGPYDHSYLQSNGPQTRTQAPTVTGTSVLAVKFNGGVAIAADNLASYGSLARFQDVKRLRTFDNSSVVGFGGDVSDMQYIDRILNSLDIRENYSSYGQHTLNAKNLHTYLSKMFYKRRSDFNPLWNHILLGRFAWYYILSSLVGNRVRCPSGLASLAEIIPRGHTN